jgi:hypothetical protein
MVLLMCWRVWRQARDGEDQLFARDGEDTLSGMDELDFWPILFHLLWPLFNLFIWVFLLPFVFSLCFLPSFLLLAGIMYVSGVLLGILHHYWAYPILNGNWKDSGEKIYISGTWLTRGDIIWKPDPEDKMESWLPKQAVQIVYNVTAPYHIFGACENVFNTVRVTDEDLSGQIFSSQVIATLFLFSLSILVTSGTHLALHVYSGHDGGELIDELYHFQYDTSHLVLPVFNTGFAAALKALATAAFGFDRPELEWGPEIFKELSRDLQTCTVLLAFLKSAIALLGYVLAAGDLISPSVGIVAAASGKKLEREGGEKGDEDEGKEGGGEEKEEAKKGELVEVARQQLAQQQGHQRHQFQTALKQQQQARYSHGGGLGEKTPEKALLQGIFDRIDDHGGEVGNKRELIIPLPMDHELCDALHLPAHIRQEDRSGDSFQRLFNEAGQNGDRASSFEEFERECDQLKASQVAQGRSNDSSNDYSNGHNNHNNNNNNNNNSIKASVHDDYHADVYEQHCPTALSPPSNIAPEHHQLVPGMTIFVWRANKREYEAAEFRRASKGKPGMYTVKFAGNAEMRRYALGHMRLPNPPPPSQRWAQLVVQVATNQQPVSALSAPSSSRRHRNGWWVPSSGVPSS